MAKKKKKQKAKKLLADQLREIAANVRAERGKADAAEAKKLIDCLKKKLRDRAATGENYLNSDYFVDTSGGVDDIVEAWLIDQGLLVDTTQDECWDITWYEQEK